MRRRKPEKERDENGISLVRTPHGVPVDELLDRFGRGGSGKLDILWNRFGTSESYVGFSKASVREIQEHAVRLVPDGIDHVSLLCPSCNKDETLCGAKQKLCEPTTDSICRLRGAEDVDLTLRQSLAEVFTVFRPTIKDKDR